MNKRELQLENNIGWVLGGYANGMTDYGLDEYPQMTEEDCIDWVKDQIYDMRSNGSGFCHYGKGVCKHLKFLGNDYIHERIIAIAKELDIIKGE